MDFLQFNERIIDTTRARCRPAFVFLTIVLLLLVKDILYFKLTQKNDGISLLNVIKVYKNRFTTKEQIALKLIAIFALLILISVYIFSAHQDISKQQYECVWGTYTYNTSSRNDTFSDGRVRVVTEGKEFYLSLPVDWHEDEFPTGTMQGFSYYSRISKIMLSFAPQHA